MSLRVRRQQRIRPPVITDINLSPLIDMVFILLIFFVVTTVFVKESGVELERPSARNVSTQQASQILISIDPRGQLYYESDPMSLNEVRLVVRRLTASEPRPVILVTDRSVTTERLVEVIDEVTGAGALSVSIAATQPEN